MSIPSQAAAEQVDVAVASSSRASGSQSLTINVDVGEGGTDDTHRARPPRHHGVVPGKVTGRDRVDCLVHVEASNRCSP